MLRRAGLVALELALVVVFAGSIGVSLSFLGRAPCVERLLDWTVRRGAFELGGKLRESRLLYSVVTSVSTSGTSGLVSPLAHQFGGCFEFVTAPRLGRVALAAKVLRLTIGYSVTRVESSLDHVARR